MKIFKKNTLLYILLAQAFIFSSCEDNFDTGKNNRTDNAISFTLAQNDFSVSRSSESDDVQTIEIKQRYTNFVVDGDTISMCVTEEPNTSVYFKASEPESRGTAITTTNVDHFHVRAVTSNNALYFDQRCDLPKTGEGVIYTDRMWPNLGTDNKLTFFGYCANEGYHFNSTVNEVADANKKRVINLNTIVENKTDNKIDFDYEVLKNETLTDGDAEIQPDLIFAVSANKTKPATLAENRPVALTFHHALSAIKFKIGTIRQDITVKTVALKNIYGKGHCSAVAKAGVSDEGNLKFSWATSGEANNRYSQAVGADRQSHKKGEQNTEITGTDDIFMLIPQDVTNAEVEITFEVKDNGFSGTRTYTFTKNISSLFSDKRWKPDTVYTIVIGIDRDETGITINEEMEGTAKKKNVSFTNDGFADGYIRAAIVGFWKNAHGDIVVPWSDDRLSTPEYGSFDWGESKTYWKKGKSDTFYYYNKIVSRGEITKPLFNAYTITSETPIDGAVLEIDIVAQLIKYDNMTATEAANWRTNWPW